MGILPPGFKHLRTRLLCLLLLALLPACALVLYGNFEQQRLEKESVRDQAVSTAKLAAASQEHYIKNARRLLGTIAELSWLVTASNRVGCDIHFQNLRIITPDYADFGLIEADGTLFSSAAKTNASPNLSGTSLFKKCVQTKRFSVSDYEEDTISGVASLRFGYPILDKDRNLYRMLYGSLHLPLLSTVLTNMALASGSTITVLDRAGNVIARLPTDETIIGKNIRNQPFVENLFRTPEGAFESRGLDSQQRLYAATTVPDGDAPTFFVAVGIPTAILYKQADEALLRNLILLLIVAALALAGGWFFARENILQPVNALVGASRRLAKGDYTARANLGERGSELHQLARDFDAMAENLARREAELRAANENISKLNAELEKRVVDRTEQLEASNRELEAFSYSVSHDLRAPLRHMDGFAQILMSEPTLEKDARSKRYLEMITTAARRMGILIDDLLQFSKMGRQSMVQQRVHFSALVREAIADCRHEQEGRNIEWKIHDLPEVECDASMLRQVWVNLISNAIKYTREKDPAVIEIGWKDSPTERTFFIRDNGAGFEMAYADKLFGVFQRLHRPEEFEGTGIGLANVRRIINRHFGETWAEGELDKGATIYFSLPKKGTFEEK
jgi:signal transduction histidine kinase